MPHRDDEVRAREHVHLAELELLGRIDVARRAQHREDRVVVAVQLRALVPVQRVFQSKGVQAELRLDLAQLGLIRPVEPDPRHATTVAHLLERLVE